MLKLCHLCPVVWFFSPEFRRVGLMLEHRVSQKIRALEQQVLSFKNPADNKAEFPGAFELEQAPWRRKNFLLPWLPKVAAPRAAKYQRGSSLLRLFL
jgi:hypothetical protein